MSLYDTLASLWRTVVPIVAGALLSMAAKAGFHIDSTVVAGWLTAAFAAGYYAVFRLLEAHVSPRWGWLLGLARPPQYKPPAPVAPVSAPPSSGTPSTPSAGA